MRRSIVSFVGAGPGDPELITLKGLRRLREAEVVLHDRLIPMSLLDEVSPGVTVIDVGKAPGRPCMGQGQINWLLVDWARRREHVVRLKGGTPRSLGASARRSKRSDRQGSPSRSSPASRRRRRRRPGSDLAHRARQRLDGRLATGTDQTGHRPSALDWDVLARAEGTLVFYMSVGALDSITASLTSLGRDPREPAILVEQAGVAGERVIAARLGEIAAEARAADVKAPAVLITGPTVSTASVPLTVRRISSPVSV